MYGKGIRKWRTCRTTSQIIYVIALLESKERRLAYVSTNRSGENRHKVKNDA